MRSSLIPILLLAGCGSGDPGNDSAAADRATRAAVQTATLTGLYQSAAGQPSQLCIVDSGTGEARFGLVTRASGDCSGAGTALRQGGVLRLAMAGDERCTIEARIHGTQVALPATLPPGCSYYCAPGARMAAAAFDKVGGTAEDAMRARDLAGDPLCG